MALFAAAAVGGGLFLGGSIGAGAQTVPVACSPMAVTAAPGQSITLAASGGDGSNYRWSSPGLTITNPLGVNFNVAFTQDGSFPVMVTSGGSTATCTVTVTGTALPGSGTSGSSPSTPGLPNTGALPE